MSSSAKRPPEFIDLTDDDDGDGFAPPKKKKYLPTDRVPSSRGSARPSFASTAASSAGQPSSSRTSVSSSNDVIWIDDDDDEPEVMDLTQEYGPDMEFYGSMDNKIVGIRYYNGYATVGETVTCHREPSNQYDRNAIRVDNVTGMQVGHIPRVVASLLAPYLDRGDIVLEAQIIGERQHFDCPVRLSFYGPSDPATRAQLEQRLKADKLLKATQLKQTKKANELQRELQRSALGLKSNRSVAGLGQSEPELSLEDLVQASQAINARQGEDIATTLAMSEEQLSNMPKAVQPEALKSQLLPYQLQGLAWLLSKEKPEFPKPGSQSSVQLWKRDARGRYVNIATNFTVSQAPQLLSGGILADDMGLGKTLQIISLILAGGSGPTLIVAPLTVMSNWQQQVQRHVRQGLAPRVLIYHGSQRKVATHQFGQFGIVVTSYGTLATEHKAPKSRLFATNWRRVVLDEGHTIRNPTTKAAEAACALKAESRWVLSGTPIVNNVKDLHALLKFLRITGGIENPAIFNALIARGLAYGEARAEGLLQSLMQDLCLRRNKEMKFVDLKLPAKTEYVHRIPFIAEERKRYNTLFAEVKGTVAEYRERSISGGRGHFQSVLEQLLRLRQICCHWSLCRQRINDLLKDLEDQGVVELNAKNRAILQEALRLFIESQEDCCVCLDSLREPVITHCKHVFCLGCIAQVVKTQGKCPMCRAELAEDQLLPPAPESSGELDDDDIDTEKKSSKTEALLKILQATLSKEGSKVIIFSQWTSFLSVIQCQLDEAGYKYARIDGSMSTAERDKAVRALDHDPNTRIMLASLAVCSVGLNLVSADTVILADSWWAPAIEDQAVDRVHRLGQTRPTTVWRLVMENSVEERVLDIQAEKRALVSKAFRDKGKAKSKETRMADIMKLLS